MDAWPSKAQGCEIVSVLTGSADQCAVCVESLDYDLISVLRKQNATNRDEIGGSREGWIKRTNKLDDYRRQIRKDVIFINRDNPACSRAGTWKSHNPDVGLGAFRPENDAISRGQLIGKLRGLRHRLVRKVIHSVERLKIDG